MSSARRYKLIGDRVFNKNTEWITDGGPQITIRDRNTSGDSLSAFIYFEDSAETLYGWIGTSGSGDGDVWLNATSNANDINLRAQGGAIVLDGQSGDVLSQNPIYLLEQSAKAADRTTYGQLVVLNTTPQQLWFYDEAGTGTQLV